MRHSPHRIVMWSTLVMALAISVASPVFGGTVYDGTPPPDPSNETHWITNPKNLSTDQKDDWYIADHPFFYNMEKVRAANGTWVDNPNATIAPFTVEEWRKNTMERVPWWIRWYVTGETRAVRKEMLAQRKNIIDNVVSPMDWGRSIRAQSVRAQWHEQLRHFWGEALGRSLWKNLKSGLQTLLFGGMQSFIEAELFAKQIKGWTMADYVAYANLTAEEYEQVKANAAEHIRDKFTRPYQYRIPADLGESAQRTLPNVLTMVKYFQPYANYTARYYDADAKHPREELPPPTLPAAISYPWPWSNRIAQLRATLVEVMRVEAARNSMANAANGNGSIENQTTAASSDQPPFRRRLQLHTGRQSSLDEESEAGVDARGEDGSGSDGSDDGNQLDDASKESSIQQLEQLAREFHFTTGMPRMETMAMKDRYTPTVFPPFETFFNTSIDANGSASIGSGDDFGSTEPEAGVASLTASTGDGNETRSLPDYSSRGGVYVAARHFYSFATVESHYLRAKDYYKPKTKAPQMPTDGTLLVDDLTPRDEKVVLVDCSAESPCVARSGVTVYTPKLASAVQDVYVNASSATPAAADAQKLKRQDWIMNIIQQAFDAEKRAMASGLQAPSTVWNSYHDRDTDIFADTVFGLVNGTKAMAVDAGLQWEPREIWEALQDNTSSPLLNGYSHFRMMALHTKNAMGTAKVPQLVPFSTEQLMRLVGFLAEILSELQTVIDAYERKRDADRMHLAIVNATKEAVYYDGRLFGVLGYGYFLPATNPANVAYRDHKVPVPFHLLMRLLTRLHESHLLLLDESVHLAACVAMLQFDVRFYRCTQVKQAERATPRPMQTEKRDLPEPLSPSPPSSSMARTSTRLNSTNRTTLPSAVPPRPSPRTATLDWS